MRNNIFRLFVILASVFSLVLASFSLAAAQEDEKAIGVRSGDSGSDGDFKLIFKPTKDVYRVDEKIQFSFKPSKTCYLYLFSIDDKNKRGYMLLPNKRQQYNKYKANTWYTVPEKTVEFYSSDPGKEKIIMVASTRKLNVRMEKYSKAGDFFTSDADTMSSDVKAISIRPRQSGEQKVVKEIALVITGEGHSAPGPGPGGAAVFISSDRKSYSVGDTMKISFGADEKGYVYLYVQEPDGGREFLKKERVDGDRFYQVKAKVTRPRGEHKVIARFNKSGELEEKAVMSKGVELIDDPDGPAAIYSFTVK